MGYVRSTAADPEYRGMLSRQSAPSLQSGHFGPKRPLMRLKGRGIAISLTCAHLPMPDHTSPPHGLAQESLLSEVGRLRIEIDELRRRMKELQTSGDFSRES